MKIFRALFLTSILAAVASAVTNKLDYVGVNESGAEFGNANIPGVFNTDYIYPSTSAIQASIDQGMNVFRVGLLWERFQHELFEEFNEFDINAYKEVIDYITSHGAVAIINPHNFARYKNGIVGSEEVTKEAFADFWVKMAKIFKDNEKVWFGLTNEPHDMDTTQWFTSARYAVDAIRKAGANNKILVPGNGYTGAWCWDTEAHYGDSNADIAPKFFSKEDKNVLFEVHQYFDTDYSGTHEECVQRPCQNKFKEFVEWLRANELRGWVGEIGGAVNEECKACVNEVLEYLVENRDIIEGVNWWAAGPWWGFYMFSIEPNANKEFPEQMAWLKPYLPGPSELETVPVFVNTKVYCKACNPTATSTDGTLWGWEDEKSCEIDPKTCESGGDSGKVYCKACNPTGTGEDGTLWGWEDEKSCEIDPKTCESGDSGKVYCKACNPTATGGDGTLWGWEDNKSCEIDPKTCKTTTTTSPSSSETCKVTQTEYVTVTVTSTISVTATPTDSSDSCPGENMGYPCCSSCISIYEDADGKWGAENNDWCSIPTSCDKKFDECWSLKYGYNCCSSSNCKVRSEDESGKWGVERKEWCGISASCKQ